VPGRIAILLNLRRLLQKQPIPRTPPWLCFSKDEDMTIGACSLAIAGEGNGLESSESGKQREESRSNMKKNSNHRQG